MSQPPIAHGFKLWIEVIDEIPAISYRARISNLPGSDKLDSSDELGRWWTLRSDAELDDFVLNAWPTHYLVQSPQTEMQLDAMPLELPRRLDDIRERLAASNTVSLAIRDINEKDISARLGFWASRPSWTLHVKMDDSSHWKAHVECNRLGEKAFPEVTGKGADALGRLLHHVGPSALRLPGPPWMHGSSLLIEKLPGNLRAVIGQTMDLIGRGLEAVFEVPPTLSGGMRHRLRGYEVP